MYIIQATTGVNIPIAIKIPPYSLVLLFLPNINPDKMRMTAITAHILKKTNNQVCITNLKLVNNLLILIKSRIFLKFSLIIE